MLLITRGPNKNSGPPSSRHNVFVDGKQIPLTWYADTDAGIVKTFDLGDGQIHTARELLRLAPGVFEVEEGNVLVSRILTGTVTLIAVPIEPNEE